MKLQKNGVAAHWDYKNPESSKRTIKVKWIQELVGILDEEAGADEFLETPRWIYIMIRCFALHRAVI